MKKIKFLIPLFLLLFTYVSKAAPSGEELKVRRNADQMADFLLRLEAMDYAQNIKPNLKELTDLANSFLKEQENQHFHVRIKNGYDFLNSNYSWLSFIPFWGAYGGIFPFLQSEGANVAHGLIGALGGIFLVAGHAILKSDNVYKGWSKNKSLALANEIYFDQLRRRGIAVKNTEQLVKSIQDLLAGVQLIESPSMMAKEIKRMKALLQSWADLMTEKNQTAKAKVLLGLKDALPSTKNPMRFLRPKAWMMDVNQTRSECISAVKELAPSLKLKSYGIDVSEISNFSKTTNNQNLRERNLIMATNDLSWAVLAKLGNNPIDSTFRQMMKSLQESEGKIDFEVQMKTLGKVTKASPTVLAEASVKFILNDGDKFESSLAENAYREAAISRLNNHALEFKFEFSTSENDLTAITQEGDWIEDFKTHLAAAVQADPVLQSRSAALSKKLRIAKECQDGLLDQNQKQEQLREEMADREFQAEAEAEVEEALKQNIASKKR